jgi:hypothetical protein
MWRSLFPLCLIITNSYSNNTLPATTNGLVAYSSKLELQENDEQRRLQVVGKERSHAPVVSNRLSIAKFDLIVDEDIDNDDPRIKSIVYSASSYQQSKIMIYYVNPNAKVLATKLVQILTKQHLLVFKLEQIQSSTLADNKYVQVIINY